MRVPNQGQIVTLNPLRVQKYKPSVNASLFECTKISSPSYTGVT
ncbi:hypothetical protein ACWODB_03415 [Facklamia hominis]